MPSEKPFVRCRAAVRTRADNQNPQFEAYENFNSWSGFLGRKASHTARRYSVYFDAKNWKVNAGALHGLPTEAEKSVGLALYAEDDATRFVGNASSTIVGAQDSELQLHFDGDTSTRYSAEITSLPVASSMNTNSTQASARPSNQSCGEPSIWINSPKQALRWRS